MLRPEHSTLIALAASLLLHGSVFYIYTEVVPEPTATRQLAPVAAAQPKRVTLLVEAEPTVAAPPEPLPVPQPVPELARLEELKPRAIIPLELAPDIPLPPPMANSFGELTGSADATSLHSLPGDLPMQARKGEQDQPQTRLESSPPAPSVALAPRAEVREQLAVPETPPVAAVAPVAPVMSPPPAPAADPSLPGPARAEPPRLLAMSPPTTAPAIAPTEPKAGAIAAPGVAQTPSVPGAGATTDSESDPFSIEGSAEFRPGKVNARFGRKVKTVRPRLSLAGQYDLFTAEPTVVLRVRADATGKVREVTIARSSGSHEIDQPCQLAMYDWWFEPPRDASGNPRPAEMLWTITFRR